MIKNIEHYVKKYKLLDSDFCNQTIEQLKNIEWHKHTFYNSTTGEVSDRSGDNELLYSIDRIENQNMITEKMWHHIKAYIREDLGFSWFDGWKDFSQPRWNKYDKNLKMAEHCDHISSLFEPNKIGVPILSVLGVLNDDYEGGDFVMFEDVKIELKQGDLIIFPSNFLYPHRVDPVKKGTRYSYISWAW